MNARPLALTALLCMSALALSGCFGSGIPEPCGPARTFPPAPERPKLAADAGPDFEVQPGDSVFLDGSASVDLEGRPLTYHWDQLEGPCVELDLKDPVKPTFEAPPVPDGGAVLRFRLVVQAGEEYSNPSEARVFVGRGEAGPAT